MPSAWTLIDSSFPTFTGKEKVKEQIPVLLNYMYMLSEGLKYQLKNLNNTNWNSSALENLKVETTADLVKQMAAVVEQINSIMSRLNGIAAQIQQAETNISTLEKKQEELEQALAAMDERMVSAEGALMELEDILQPDGEGGLSIGSDGKNVYLVGNIYVNGQLLTL